MIGRPFFFKKIGELQVCLEAGYKFRLANSRTYLTASGPEMF